MPYKNIFRQAYTLTMNNPLLWLFGLVLLGGFNLSLINFSALIVNDYWKVWPVPMNLFYGVAPSIVILFSLAMITTFLVVHLAKVVFVVKAHNLIHNSEKEKLCRLCVYVENKNIPYLVWWVRIMTTSIITIVFTSVVSIAVNALLTQAGPSRINAMIINLIFLIVVTCILGIWNTFATYFIILHDMNFQSAVSSAWDLLVLHWRRIFEFVVILSAIYTLSVIVGNAFISGYQHGFGAEGLFDVRIIFLIAFLVWFSINNSYFNLSFLLFFDDVVKATPSAEKAVLPQAV